MLFKELVKSTIPASITNNKINNDVIDIILSYIEEKVPMSYDISSIFANKVVKKEVVNTYLENISNAFSSALTDTNIIEKLIKAYKDAGLTYNPNNIKDITEIYTDEYLNTAKVFKQRKGTIPAIKFAYNAIRNARIQTTDTNFDINDVVFNILEGTTQNKKEPFTFRVEGSMYEEIYENAVKPIVHPVGFGYIYTKVLSLLFQEFFNVKLIYSNRNVKVKCNNGESFIDFSHKDIKVVYNESDANGRIKTIVEFDDNSRLEKDFNTTVKYYKSDGSVDSFPDSCALYLAYDLSINTLIEDSFEISYDREISDNCRVGGNFYIGPTLIIGKNGVDYNGKVGNWIISQSSEFFELIIENNYNNMALNQNVNDSLVTQINNTIIV